MPGVGQTHLSDVLEVVVAFLQGPGSVEGLAHAGVFAEESLAVVLDPVHHLEGREEVRNPSRIRCGAFRPEGLKTSHAAFYSGSLLLFQILYVYNYHQILALHCVAAHNNPA